MLSMGAGLIDDFITILSVPFCPIPFCPIPCCPIPFCPIPFCPYTILSIPFCPYHFVRYHFVLETFLHLTDALDTLSAIDIYADLCNVYIVIFSDEKNGSV